MANQPMKDLEDLISKLYFLDLDKIREAIREEIEDEIRQEVLDEIRQEIADAVNAASSDDAPEIGTDLGWGKDDEIGLLAFQAYFDRNW